MARGRKPLTREDEVFYSKMTARIDETIYDNNKTKLAVSKARNFERKTLYGVHGMQLNYFARLCIELGVSADYLLFGNADHVK